MQDPAASSRAHTSLSLAIVLFVVAFMLPMFVPVPLLWYHPLEGAWRFEVTPTTLGMDWYGRLLWGVVAAGVGLALGRLVPARAALTRRAKAWWAFGALGIVVAAVTIKVVLMVARTPVPLAPPGATSGVAADERPVVAHELRE
jgi:hypothetical protein